MGRDRSETVPGPAPASWRGLAAWALYDWANSPFTTLVVTFVFPAYFAGAVVGDETAGQALWGYAMGLTGAVIAVGSPVLGSFADVTGRRKPWILGFTALCAVGSSCLWYAEPNERFVGWAMVWVIAANLGFEFAGVFYNAMLPELVGRDRIGRLSGWGWALGYAGGLAALVFALTAFVKAERPLFGLDKQSLEQVRIIGPLAAAWLALFSVPLFLWTPERTHDHRPARGTAAGTLRELARTLRSLAGFGATARFLVAHMLYSDGLVTIFTFGGVYAAGVFKMDMAGIIGFGILLNITAGLGAFGFGWIDDWLGSAQTVRLALIGLIVCGIGVLLAPDVFWFWLFGGLLGIFVGPAQAASRSLMARLAPPDRHAEMFGLLALSGKATAFLGPTFVALTTEVTGSQRLGLSVVLMFLAAGLALMLGVSDEAAPVAAHSGSRL